MPMESALFIARRGWSSVLKKTSHVYVAWCEACDNEFVDYEEEWRPFPELLPFLRWESSLQDTELATLVALVRGEPPPFDKFYEGGDKEDEDEDEDEGGDKDEEACRARLLPAPNKLSDAQRALFSTLDYAYVAVWPDDVSQKLLALDEAALRALAARWGESPGSVAGSSLDIGRRPDWLAELTRLRAFFKDLPSSKDEDGGPLFLVIRSMN
ncbi:hypothetical protein [Nannocystis punicea]|uniref:Uncharacterized protein n=1 Tax=Nannocystis punicea TaxID=2995304 RepID=A0ABY7H978_9BACT|nr:hypothetical protein [Nannocystis poenicansa]WAS95813.1 hypothetical protein O0S08_06585 [Nannocystis poenicansa]